MTTYTKLLILGGGLAGLSVGRWTKNLSPLILERSDKPGGHLQSDNWAGATWDQGPHVSFTKDAKVKELLAADLGSNYREFPSRVENYDQGSWIPHPIQSHLYALPPHIRTAAADAFLRRVDAKNPQSYRDWLHGAYGEFLAEEYMGRYTQKYWTCDPKAMGTDWVGLRMRIPSPEEIAASLVGPPTTTSHYITTVRYPTQGGFAAYITKFIHEANVQCNTEIQSIDLEHHRVTTNTDYIKYDRLVNTIPLPEFVHRCIQATPGVRAAAERLRCTSLWLIDVVTPHARRRDFHWAYVYDRDKLSTRITHMDALGPENTSDGHAAIQVEVYDSPYRPIALSPNAIRERVIQELRSMGLVDGMTELQSRIRRIPYANVLFDHQQRAALDAIWTWAESFGLHREPMDLHPLTDWTAPAPESCGELSFAGRFGQWKYAWTDDCIRRGMQIAASLDAGPWRTHNDTRRSS